MRFIPCYCGDEKRFVNVDEIAEMRLIHENKDCNTFNFNLRLKTGENRKYYNRGGIPFEGAAEKFETFIESINQ